jgi:outer membrane receptor protein involved in Fe transport
MTQEKNTRTYTVKNKISNLSPVLLIITFSLFFSVVSLDVFAADVNEANDLFAMSLEQLMDVGVYAPATLTEKDPLKTPASVTTITSRDIELTPARNILDLIEIYVPGALWFNHNTGPTLGMRGITDRSKYLVTINGININIRPLGALPELLNWELNDIDRIEIVRGPGSVTYGPGAISGVINIYTKKAKQALGVQFGGSYWGKYNSVGNWVSYGRVKDDFELYTYFSAVDTEGLRHPNYYTVDRAGSSPKYRYRAGYIGTGGPYSPRPPTTYMGNYYEEPEIKAHLDIKFNDNWRFWGRYVTESSQYTLFNNTQWLIDNKYQDLTQQRYRHFILALENQHTINKDWDLKSTFSLSSVDVRDIQKQNASITNNNRENLQNYGRIYSDWKNYAQFMLNYKPEDSKLKGALGFEVSYNLIRPGWGKDKNNGLRISDGIMSGPDSDAYGSGYNQYDGGDPEYYGVGNGWETLAHAFIGELNYELTPKTTMILSGRMDKHSYTNYAFSPRLALIHELNKDEYLKFIMQRSIRMNTEEELYMTNVGRQENFPEKLDTVELIYSKKVNDRFSYQTSVFFSKLKAIAWNATAKSSIPAGTLELFGLEIEAKYKRDNFDLGVNHSIVKQLSWQLSNGIYSSGISYSDYYANTGVGGVVIKSYGNDLSNWANQSTKIFTNIKLLKDKATLHADMRAYWGFEGLEQGLEALDQAGGNDATIEALREKKVYGILAVANVSLTYHINKSADVAVFVQNFPVFGHNKRYSSSSGYTKEYPDKTCWTEEPMVVGVKYKIQF